MQKSYLFDLISVVRGVLDENELPVIVGSQSIFAQTEDPPRVVRESRECDFLLFGGKSVERDRINSDYGVFSPFADEKGYYADALGLASVVLPTGWEDRLIPFQDSEGKIVARCLDRYDLAASKIAAGRPKDIEFLADAFESGLLSVDDFLGRASLVKDKLENDALRERFERLLKHLNSSTPSSESVNAIRDFVKQTF